jgi:hypothetical protein
VWENCCQIFEFFEFLLRRPFAASITSDDALESAGARQMAVSCLSVESLYALDSAGLAALQRVAYA